MEDKILVAQIAPAVRVAIGEEFGSDAGTVSIDQIVTGLKMLGFDYVFDTQFSADLTIIEEASELISRIKNKGVLPMFSSCCPAWVSFMENQFPELTPHLSTCKSPHLMMGAVVKTYFAEKKGIDPKNIYLVSIMPCLVKKDEAKKDFSDVDAVLSTREIATLFKREKINLPELASSLFDDPLGTSTGAGAIFGVTGGVAEAALRTVYEKMTGGKLETVDFEALHGLQGLKKTAVTVGDLELRIAVADGIFQAKLLIDEVKKGSSPYHFIEVMSCQGGCIGGSGQPRPVDLQKRIKRAKSIYDNDKNQTIRKSHENPAAKKLYEEFLDEPGSEKANKLLHRQYNINNYKSK